MAKKKHIGFDTAATELQDEFEEILKGLGIEKAAWDKLRLKALSILEEEKGKGQSRGGDLAAILLGIAALGLTIVETHKRLAGVEKSVKELSRSIK